MPNRDWDMEKRRERVLLRGTERSEYVDIVAKIARAKGCAKRGTNLVKCQEPDCDGYYEIGQVDQHRHSKNPPQPRSHRHLKSFKGGKSTPNASFGRYPRQPRTDKENETALIPTTNGLRCLSTS